MTYRATLGEVGRRLRAEREERGWSRVGMASRLRAAAGSVELPGVESLAHMVKEWERGKHGPGSRYQRLYCVVFGVVRPRCSG